MRHPRLQTATPSTQDLVMVRESLLFRQYSSKLRDVNDHKWYESERAGHDIGFNRALFDWIFKHARHWERRQQETVGKSAK